MKLEQKTFIKAIRLSENYKIGVELEKQRRGINEDPSLSERKKIFIVCIKEEQELHDFLVSLSIAELLELTGLMIIGRNDESIKTLDGYIADIYMVDKVSAADYLIGKTPLPDYWKAAYKKYYGKSYIRVI